jgi:hypothetical protein
MNALTPRRLAIILTAALAAACGLLPMPARAYIYWTSNSGTTIGRANNDGSSVNQQFIAGAQHPCGVTVDGSHIYWANEGSPTSATVTGTTIGRANLDGSSPDENFIKGAFHPCGVAIDGSHIYWANTGLGGGNSIGRANLDGTGVDQNFITGANGPCGVAVDAGHIYWANWGGGLGDGKTIGRANLDGSGANENFITGANGPCGIAVDDRYVYWANSGPYQTGTGTTIGRSNLDGSGVKQQFITGADVPCGVAAGAGFLYWGNEQSSEAGIYVGRANLDGSQTSQKFLAGTLGVCVGAVDGGSAPPSNVFAIGAVTLHRKAGSATVPVTVPGPGDVSVSGPALRQTAVTTPINGTVTLTVAPTAQAAKRLKAKGRLKFQVTITYTPAAGTANSESTAIQLVRKH